MHQTVNGTGAVTGASRLIFAVGQAVSPIASLGVYSVAGLWAPFALAAALQCAALAVYVPCGVHLWREPDWTAVRACTVALHGGAGVASCTDCTRDRDESVPVESV